MVAIGCQAVVGRGEVGFHRLATGGYELNCLALKRSHPLPSGGWRGEVGFHRLATGG
jgi:hypothetical protein